MKKIKAELVRQLKSKNPSAMKKAKAKLIEMNSLYNLLFDPDLGINTNTINKLIKLSQSEDNLDLKFIEIDKLSSIVIAGENSEKITDYLIELYNTPHRDNNSRRVSEYAKEALIKKRIACEELYKYINKWIRDFEIFLIILLHDSNIELKRNAAEVLKELGLVENVQFLIDTINDYNKDIRQLVVCGISKSLESMSSKIVLDIDVEPLVRILVDSNLTYSMNKFEITQSLKRISDAEVLGKIKNRVVVPFLNTLLSDSNDDYVRSIAEIALEKIAPKEVVDLQIKTLSDSNDRCQAVELLSKIGSDVAIDYIINALFNIYEDVRNAAGKALGKIESNKVVDRLIMTLYNGNEDHRIAAAKGLGRIGSDRAVDHLINVLSDSNEEIRIAAAEALGEIGSDKAVDHLIKALSDSNEEVIYRAEESLGKIGSGKAVSHIIKVLSSNSDLFQPEALGRIGSNKAVQFLFENFYSKPIKTEASILWQVGTRKSIEAFINLLNNSIKKHNIGNFDEFIKMMKETNIMLQKDIEKIDILCGNILCAMEILPMDLRKYILDIAIPLPQKSHDVKGMMM